MLLAELLRAIRSKSCENETLFFNPRLAPCVTIGDGDKLDELLCRTPMPLPSCMPRSLGSSRWADAVPGRPSSSAGLLICERGIKRPTRDVSLLSRTEAPLAFDSGVPTSVRLAMAKEQDGRRSPVGGRVGGLAAGGVAMWRTMLGAERENSGCALWTCLGILAVFWSSLARCCEGPASVVDLDALERCATLLARVRFAGRNSAFALRRASVLGELGSSGG
jgi:hypothetical protein